MTYSYSPFLVIQKSIFNIALVSIFSVTLPATGCSNGSQKQVNTTSTKSVGFVFDVNESGESAEKRLLERFPVGSKMSDFTSAMKKTKILNCSDHTNEMVCEYIIPTTGAASYRWLISASNNQDKIVEIYMRKYFTPYYPNSRQDESTTKKDQWR